MNDLLNKELLNRLFALKDEKYRAFQCRLMPTVLPETVIGVRTPLIRALAKEYKNHADISAFLHDLPHHFYEENNLHAFILETIGDMDTAVAEIDRFLPYINNWATCDSMSPKVFKYHKAQLLSHIRYWIASPEVYTVRFAVEMLMNHFLDDSFDPAYPEMVASVRSDEYYINMMCAWYFATALAKQYEKILPYLQENRLPRWTHNKTIQKAVESYRITDVQKAYLRTLKV